MREVYAQSDSITSKRKTITAEQFAKLNFNYCDTFSMEVSGFYPVLKVLPSIENDSIHLVRILKREGWETTNGGGWGNWQKGPRFIKVDMKKGNCDCTVIKSYYNYHKMKDGYYSLKVTEAIFCNKEYKYVEK